MIKKDMKGFTLIELLAVITIMTIVFLIAVPIVMNYIDYSRKQALISTTKNLVKQAQMECEANEECYFVLEDGILYKADAVYTKGEYVAATGSNGEDGVIHVNEDGVGEIAIHNSKWCAYKDIGDKAIYSTDYEEGKCKLTPNVIEQMYNKLGEETTGYDGCEGTGSLVKIEHLNVENDESKVSYRYQGKCPNNYVTFNNETWRIIGVVDGKLKLIRDESIGYYSWDNKDTTTGAESNNGKNEWTEARLMKLLNPGYQNEEIGGSLYWNKGKGLCYYGQNNATIGCDFTSITMSIEAQDMIDQNSKWYLGAWNTADITKDVMYEKERGTTTWNNSRKTEWIGAVGLMYPSDYGYAAGEGCEQTLSYYNDSTCRSVNWMDQSLSEWTITHSTLSSFYLFRVSQSGQFYLEEDAFNTRVIRPSLYLKSDTKIVGGDGTPTNPYKLAH